VARPSIGQQAAEAIKAMILSGALRPGDALPSERDLAVKLGISRPSLREAIKALAMLNVLEVRHGGGTYVTSLDPSLLAQPISFLLEIDRRSFERLLELRIALEVGATHLAVGRASEEQIGELERIVDKVAHELSQPSRFPSLAIDIHAKIVEATNNPLYVRVYQSVVDLSLEEHGGAARGAAVPQRAREDHVEILAAIRRRDSKAAAAAMHEHLERFGQLECIPGTR
jgi:DNA-binding FadR family transcriptional regulator